MAEVGHQKRTCVFMIQSQLEHAGGTYEESICTTPSMTNS